MKYDMEKGKSQPRSSPEIPRPGTEQLRAMEGQQPLQQPHPQEQQGLGPAWRTKNEERRKSSKMAQR